jgi:hypothetical protein
MDGARPPPLTCCLMSARRVRSLMAATAIAAVLSHGLSGHGLPQVSSHDDVAGAAAGVCLLLASALVFTVMPTPRRGRTAVLRKAVPIAVSSAPRVPLDGRSRASPSVLERFRN